MSEQRQFYVAIIHCTTASHTLCLVSLFFPYILHFFYSKHFNLIEHHCIARSILNPVICRYAVLEVCIPSIICESKASANQQNVYIGLI